MRICAVTLAVTIGVSPSGRFTRCWAWALGRPRPKSDQRLALEAHWWTERAALEMQWGDVHPDARPAWVGVRPRSIPNRIFHDKVWIVKTSCLGLGRTHSWRLCWLECCTSALRGTPKALTRQAVRLTHPHWPTRLPSLEAWISPFLRLETKSTEKYALLTPQGLQNPSAEETACPEYIPFAVGATGLNLQERCYRVHIIESAHNALASLEEDDALTQVFSKAAAGYAENQVHRRISISQASEKPLNEGMSSLIELLLLCEHLSGLLNSRY